VGYFVAAQNGKWAGPSAVEGKRTWPDLFLLRLEEKLKQKKIKK